MAIPAERPVFNKAIVDQLRAELGDRVSTSRAVREHHGRGEDWFPVTPPDAVCFVESNEEVAGIVRICADHKIPVIAYGTGTSLEGHVTAPYGGVCIDLSGMNEVVEVNREDLDCRVQAGVTRKQINEYLRDTGLFFPVDPGADASLGGMAATRASGTNAVRYGTMRENVLGLTAVMADGRVVRTGGRARKSAAGYDLTRLLVGSEGTLGIITEVQLRLYGIPEKMAAAVGQYPSLAAAVNTAMLTIQSGIPIARMELLDEIMMGATIDYSKLEGYERRNTLFFEFHGTAAAVEEQARMVREISDEFGGTNFRWTATTEDRNVLWQARHDAYYAILAMQPGKFAMSTDVCVPISRLAETILETQEDLIRSGFQAPILGHVGDGNFHSVFLVDLDDAEEMATAKAANERMVQRALAKGGTCTGEHGIGIGKQDYLIAEHGEAVSIMRQIKNALDPDNIMNPGKVLRV